MSEIAIKLDVPHNDEDWHQWVHIGEIENRDRIGRRNPNGWTRWMVVQCNNTECPGRALVRSTDIEDEVEHRFPVPSLTPQPTGIDA